MRGELSRIHIWYLISLLEQIAITRIDIIDILCFILSSLYVFFPFYCMLNVVAFIGSMFNGNKKLYIKACSFVAMKSKKEMRNRNNILLSIESICTQYATSHIKLYIWELMLLKNISISFYLQSYISILFFNLSFCVHSLLSWCYFIMPIRDEAFSLFLLMSIHKLKCFDIQFYLDSNNIRSIIIFIYLKKKRKIQKKTMNKSKSGKIDNFLLWEKIIYCSGAFILFSFSFYFLLSALRLKSCHLFLQCETIWESDHSYKSSIKTKDIVKR